METPATPPKMTIEDLMKDINALNKRVVQREKALNAHLGYEVKPSRRQQVRRPTKSTTTK